jgi:tRNA G18 (ribose-2'-O)-methylase SpoU
MFGTIGSLNVSVACGAFMKQYDKEEYAKHRLKKRIKVKL